MTNSGPYLGGSPWGYKYMREDLDLMMSGGPSRIVEAAKDL